MQHRSARAWLVALLLVVVLALQSSAVWAACAWVLWSHGSIIGTYPTELRKDQPWQAVEGWSTRTECDADRAVRLQRDQQLHASPEWKRQWRDLMGEYADTAKPEVQYACLPDTIDPRGPKGTR